MRCLPVSQAVNASPRTTSSRVASTSGGIPVGYHAAIPTTNRVLVPIRAIPPAGNNDAANELMKTVKIYPLNRPADWKEPGWVRLATGDFTPLQRETSLQYWQVPHEVIEAGPAHAKANDGRREDVYPYAM